VSDNRTGCDRYRFSGTGAAARPYSTKRRIASLRDSIALALHHLLIATITGFGRRTVTAGSRPVAGRPRPRFLWCTVIDFDIFWVYQKIKLGGSGRCELRPMSHRLPERSDDITVYLVLNDYGKLGSAYVETDPAEADRESIIRNFLSGQYGNAVQVVAFNTTST
jgi:hypothetical protein